MLRQKSKKSLEGMNRAKADCNLQKFQPNPAAQGQRVQREGTNTGFIVSSNNTVRQMNVIASVPPKAALGNATNQRRTTRQRSVVNGNADLLAANDKTLEKDEKDTNLVKQKKDNRKRVALRVDRNCAYRGTMVDNSQQHICGIDDVGEQQPQVQFHYNRQLQQQNMYPRHQHQIQQKQPRPQQLPQKPNQLSRSNQQQQDLNKEKINSQVQQSQEDEKMDEDKDEGSEEFFELIKQTVESAIGKSICELLNRNFRDIAAKIDQFANELSATNEALAALQNDVNNKIVHYGEENSRHYRYLCMKSEYDKIFYQHQSIINGMPQMSQMPPAPQSPQMPQVLQFPQAMAQTQPQMAQMQQISQMAQLAQKQQQTQMPPLQVQAQQMPQSLSQPNTAAVANDIGSLQSPRCIQSVTSGVTIQQNFNAYKQNLNGFHSDPKPDCLSNVSSEANMRDILDHIQRFCVQIQGNETFKTNGGEPTQPNLITLEGATIINKDIFVEEEEEGLVSSDGMTPRSEAPVKIHDNKPVISNAQCGMGDA